MSRTTQSPDSPRRATPPPSGAGAHRPARRRRAALALAATVLVGAAAAGCTDGTGAGSSSAPTATTPPAGEDAVPALADQPSGVPLGAGRYVVRPFDAVLPLPADPVLEVPAGYLPLDGAGIRDDGDGDPRALTFWDVRAVYTHPCAADGYPEDVGASVADLAAALAAQPLREATAPVAVTVGGYDGLYLELGTPADLDLATCRDGYFHTWPGRSDRVPGATDLVWVLDVEGRRLTVDLSLPPSATAEQVEALRAVAAATTFVRRDGS
ncbi:hypothetical protein [Cellulomonas endophytica]|uniref:hypothetical protein n=1 Tax=Cellulomonas endophytica TaxID=2494735 RepID=UPI001013AF13|nr:hypothetical protein [Cellulomonas endophytica]